MSKTEMILELFKDKLDENEIIKLKTILSIVLEEPSEIPPIDELLTEFQKYLMLTGRKSTSIAQYTLEIHIMMKYVDKEPQYLSTRDIKDYLYRYQSDHNISMVTMQNKIRYLSSFYEFLLNESYIQKNPTKAIGRVITPVKIKRAFSDTDLQKIRLHSTTLRDRAMIEFLLATGARVSECARLKVSDVDFEGSEVILFGKGHKERIVYLSQTAISWLFKYLDDRSPDINEPLFANINEHAFLTSRGIEKILARIGYLAGVNNVHPHRFRRTFATNLWKQGVPTETIRILMGHTNIQTTMRYIDIDDQTIKESYMVATM